MLDRELYTIPEAADYLRLSDSTIRRLIRNNELPSFRSGGRRVVIRLVDLRAYVDRKAQQGEQERQSG